MIRLLRVFLMGALGASWWSAWPAGAEGACPGNLLYNPSFEEGYRQTSLSSHLSTGWYPWFQQGPYVEQGYFLEPEYKGEDATRYGFRRVLDGLHSQKFFNSFGTHNAGFFQTVAVPEGARVRFSIWVQVWSTQQSDSDGTVERGNYWLSVGIDPTGGMEWSAASVVWSRPLLGRPEWEQLAVEALAQAGRVTVFSRGAPEWRVKHNDSYWDLACLEVVGLPGRELQTVTAPSRVVSASGQGSTAGGAQGAAGAAGAGSPAVAAGRGEAGGAGALLGVGRAEERFGPAPVLGGGPVGGAGALGARSSTAGPDRLPQLAR